MEISIDPARSAPRAPGDDMWMVRVTVTSETRPGRGEISRFTAVDLDEDDVTPGVYPLLFEHGTLHRDAATGVWANRRDTIVAWNDHDARRVTAATYDAARGFLELGHVPDTAAVPISTPDTLRIEIGDDTWTFGLDEAPQQAWAVLQAASGASELGRGRAV